MRDDRLEDFGNEIEADSIFRFECRPELNCFGMCCTTEIILTPYDIARMRRHLSIDTGTLLSTYCNTYIDPHSGFPFVILRHKDDKCVFFGRHGCDVYESRPSCCRNYPLARVIDEDHETGKRLIRYYLQQGAAYCEGLGRGPGRTIQDYCKINGLEPFEKANDLFLDIPFTFNRLPHNIRQDREIQSMIFESVFNFDCFFEKYGRFSRSSMPKDDYEMIVLVRSVALNLIENPQFPAVIGRSGERTTKQSLHFTEIAEIIAQDPRRKTKEIQQAGRCCGISSLS